MTLQLFIKQKMNLQVGIPFLSRELSQDRIQIKQVKLKVMTQRNERAKLELER